LAGRARPARDGGMVPATHPSRSGAPDVPRRISLHSRERKVRRPGSPVPPEISDRRHLRAGAPLRCSCLSPNGVPPSENPLPSVGLSLGRPPLNDRHREVAVLMLRTLHVGCRNPGQFGLQFRCPRAERRHQGRRNGWPGAEGRRRPGFRSVWPFGGRSWLLCTELPLRRPGEREPRH
jgi:hypothetical protein